MRWLVTAALCASLMTPGVGSAQTARVPLDSAEVRRWREDLAWLSREMPAAHANLFHTLTRAQFDTALGRLSAALPTLARHEVIVELMRVAASVSDGHTNVSPWRDTVIAFQRLPVALYRFADGYYIRAADPAHAHMVGAKLVRIGRVSVDSAEQMVAPLISRDNSMGVWLMAPVLLQMPEILHAVGILDRPDVIDLTVDLAGTLRTVTVGASGRFPNLSGDIDRSWATPAGWADAIAAGRPLWLSSMAMPYAARLLRPSSLMYCQINTIDSDPADPIGRFVERALAEASAAGASRFVLDLRLNGGGNGFFNREIVRAVIRSPYDTRGRLFVITGRRTFSAAQMLISELEKWTNATFVGEPSASRGNHFGDSRRLVLPNQGITVRVSTLRWQYWDPRDTRPWIAPQLAADLTFAAYAAGRDPALERIVSSGSTPPLSEQLRPLVARRDTAGALRHLNEFSRDSVNRWQDVPRLLSEMRRELLAEGAAAEAALASYLRTTFVAAGRRP